MTSLLRERPAPGVELLRLNRPGRLNAFDTDLLGRVNDALAAIAGDDGIHAVVFAGEGGALSAGADVDEALDREAGVARMEAFARMYAGVEACPAVTIAVCAGHCLGAGAELAAGCDLRVAADTMKARWVGARHGVPVGPARLAPLLGTAVAKDLVLTGRPLLAEEALRLGFVRSVHPAGEALGAALELAGELAAQPGVRTLKALFRDLDGTPARVAHENALLVEFQRAGAGLPRR